MKICASAEQHREWFQKEGYSQTTWMKEGYPKYKDQGAVYDPCRFFNKPWSWFTGNEIFSREIASTEQHREWIQKEGFTHRTWMKEGYPKYKDEGAVAAPDKKFGKPWSWFSGNEMFSREFASAEQHREWIIDGNYTYQGWQYDGYPKYKDEGAVSQPNRKFDKPWSWFTGRKPIQENLLDNND